MNTPPDREGAESPSPADRDRAAHWRDFYHRVTAFEEAILGQMIEFSRTMPEEERRLVVESDIRPLRSLIEGFRRRRDVWQRAEGKSGQGPADFG